MQAAATNKETARDSAIASQEEPALGNELVIGQLGLGRAGVMHAKILNSRVARLVIADPQPGRAEQVAAELAEISRAQGISGARVEIASPEEIETGTGRAAGLDGVVITSPTNVHGAQIIAVAQRGLPVFCEKPVATSLAETLRVCANTPANAPIHIGFQRRFDPAYSAARKHIAAGKLGELRRVIMHTMDQNPPHREFLAASGGIFVDCLIHDFDVLRWVTGQEVEEVFAYGNDLGLADFRDFADAAETVAVLKMTGGVLVTASSSRYNGHGYDVRMELHGTTRTEVVGMDEKLPLDSLEPGVSYPQGEPWVDFIARFADCYVREIDAFLKVIQTGEAVPAGLADAVRALEIAEAAQRSFQEHRPVTVAEIQQAHAETGTK
ncbi:myo-inositol 2-dehydrogenase / D-chiro-inositol 1-dehydrogenase [Actinobaculum suis]|uniref:Gfo/Idh/MocA family oxidoreductase n=1 Tax=Actinobaculum suis TaxID=1657 RepID=A0A1G7AUP0_9ACTO|nr:Gfo/Idh/MocA family oxidoreductase [Actinobaculum suis]MDY5153422.1 Gfo/Idh/MocA family oxidoreductase [Actinobaculum suis]SDE17666.1 myo-inositol 2-dehydrogenase / D-chiro-inositol 1-dehydrogenase [Actinobaculum suis]